MTGLVDFDFLLYEQSSYAIYGGRATLTVADSAGTATEIDAIDETAGVEVLDGGGVATVLPAVAVRAAQLGEKGIAVADLPGASLTFNSKQWTVIRHQYRPTPEGEARGELLLLLEEADGA